MTLRKHLFVILKVITFSFSNIALIVIPSTSKLVDSITYILFSLFLIAEQVNQTFIVTIKTMVYFISYFSGEASEFISNISVLTNLTPKFYPVEKEVGCRGRGNTLRTLPFFQQNTT